MPEFAEIRFKGTRKDYFTCRAGTLDPGSWVLVEAERGRDLGRVSALGAIAERKCGSSGGCATPEPSRRVLRRARADEIRHMDWLRTDEERVRARAREMAASRKLKMKVAEAEWQFDRKKLILYFTADRRVDFRALVHDLARTFRTRIELRQIGVRDEAAMLGGVGRCGRELCCSTWLPSLRPVSLQLAKNQRLSLNPSQISGCCGRLMCCLRYEHDAYVRARRRFPREGRRVNTSLGAEKVVAVDIWSETVTLLADGGGRRKVALEELRKEVSEADPGKRSGRPGT